MTVIGGERELPEEGEGEGAEGLITATTTGILSDIISSKKKKRKKNLSRHTSFPPDLKRNLVVWREDWIGN